MEPIDFDSPNALKDTITSLETLWKIEQGKNTLLMLMIEFMASKKLIPREEFAEYLSRRADRLAKYGLDPIAVDQILSEADMLLGKPPRDEISASVEEEISRISKKS